eukprot:scaffold168489_cov23-Tisochrysis_lutea.AAC.1
MEVSWQQPRGPAQCQKLCPRTSQYENFVEGELPKVMGYKSTAFVSADNGRLVSLADESHFGGDVGYEVLKAGGGDF